MHQKMTLGEWFDRVRDPRVSDEDVMAISVIRRGLGAFDFQIAPDPEFVEIPPEEAELENAMQIGNGMARRRRAAKFLLREISGDGSPVLVSEMDSWGQFPFLIREVVDHLNEDFMIWSVGAAGDTAQNMVFGPERPGGTEYMRALRRQKDKVRAFVFSAAGNDIIGEDPVTEVPVLMDLLKSFSGDENDVAGHLDQALLDTRIDFLRGAYRKVIDTIRAEPGFETLPILVHGYDYPFPYPFGNDHRNPIWAARDKWLGAPMAARDIPTETLGRKIVMHLIDRLYALLDELSADALQTGVWVVDCRGAMPDLADWADEIHGTSDGFAKVATRFKAVLDELT